MLSRTLRSIRKLELKKTEAVAAECARLQMLAAVLGSPASAATYLLEKERLRVLHEKAPTVVVVVVGARSKF